MENSFHGIIMSTEIRHAAIRKREGNRERPVKKMKETLRENNIKEDVAFDYTEDILLNGCVFKNYVRRFFSLLENRTVQGKTWFTVT